MGWFQHLRIEVLPGKLEEQPPVKPKNPIQLLYTALLRLIGWRVRASQPLPAKCVIIGAPHTSNWDLPFALMLMGATGARFKFLAKDTVFRGPFGWVMRSWGGIPVNRRKSENVVEQMVAWFAREPKLQLAIMPEGTRRKKSHWKSGFYHIAAGAGVPVVLGFIDYGSKTVGWGPFLMLTGRIAEDFSAIREFYLPLEGKFPEQQSEIRLETEPDYSGCTHPPSPHGPSPGVYSRPTTTPPK